ncbi:MAG: RagB/SusD family nutrient uptake outer membrane protein [Prevotellaceae bacterium]|nr:RagB/SusD family nutrient uptake outer membrane protein [Prevotellaceae bacterium]
MRKIYYKILIFTLLTTFFSCGDFLERKPKLGLTEGTVLRDRNDAEAFITSCYDGLQEGFDEYYVWDRFIYGDAMADNAYSGGDDPDIIQIDKLTVAANNLVVMRDWKSLYGGILRCNVVLKYVPEIADKDLDNVLTDGISRRQQILAEAAFLRAFHYFNIVRLWGDVPIVTTTGSIAPEDIFLPRLPKSDVIKQIINDLLFASQYLPQKWANNSETCSRATLGMANALMAKVYAIDGAPHNVNWAKVEEYCNKVIDSGIYDLLDDFNSLFDDAHRNNRESILIVQYLAGTEESNYAPQLLLPPSKTGDTWRKYITPSHDLIADFDNEGDEIRKNASIIFEDIKNIWTDEYYSVQNGSRWETRTLPFPYKMRHANGWQSGDQIYLIRLADIVLLRAEAVNQTKGFATAADDPLLKKIRQRVGLQPIAPSSKEQMAELLLRERRLELAFEGHRFYDLQRSGKFVETMNNIELNILISNKMEIRKYNAQTFMNLLPIPQSERDRNKNLSQNEGY